MDDGLRVRLAGGDADDDIAAAVEAAGDALAVTTMPGDPADVEPAALADADAVVWAGDATDGFDALLAAADEAGLPVIAYGDGDPAEALTAGADDFVHRTESGPTVLAHRIERLADGDAVDPELGAAVTADGGAVHDGLAANRHFRAIVEQASDPIFVKDREGRYVYINEPGAALFDAEPAEVVGKTDAELFGEESAAEIRADDLAVMERGETVTVSASREYDDGERVFQTRKHPYRPDGEVEGVIGIARDVTEQAQTKAELERNEQALRDLQRLASNLECPLEGKLERALEIGRGRLDLPLGFLTRIEDGTQTIVASRGDHDELTAGESAPLSEAYCRKAVEREGLLGVEHAAAEGWSGDPAYDRFELECYLGGAIRIDGELYGTLCFADTERRDRSFTDAEETFIELLIEWVSYEVERRERERELERADAIVRSVDDGVYEVDADGRFTFVNPAMAALTGYDPDELEGEHLSVVKDDPETAAALEALLSGDATERTVESPVHRRRGTAVPCEDSMTRLTGEDGEIRGVVGVLRDVTEQKAHREMLSGLVESSRTLMQARDREEVAEMVARAVRDVLGFDLTVVRLFDREDEQLVPAGTTGAVDERDVPTPTFDIDDGGPGAAFVSGTTEIGDGSSVPADGEAVVGSAMHLPMGVHGTISIGAEEADAFSDVDRRAAELLATSAAAAANRAKREAEVRQARERVDTLVDRINGLIEDTVEVLVQAGTREELERGVVEQLVAAEPYAFAWIGRPDLAAETIEPTDWDGDVPALADALDGAGIDVAADDDPVARALAEEELQVVDDLAAASSEGVHAAAAAAGLDSLIAVPLAYKDASYGVLTVYAADPDAFAEREQVVLGALGRAVANAVNAIESGRILSTNRVIEMEFTVRDEGLLFGRLSARSGADLELTGTVYQSDGDLRAYVTASGADPDEIDDLLADDPDVREGSIITDHDGEVLFEATVADSLVEMLADHGAVTQAASASDGVVRVTIELPYEAEAREVFELVADRYEGTDLVGYHEHERPVQTRQEFRETVTERFTDRQETAVRTAHLGGFFEWPREIDGDELAESMGITRPTYHQHLRAAQRKVFDELFDPSHDRRL